MRYDLILKNGTVVTSSESFAGDVAVSNGKIVKTGKLENDDTADEVYDAGGKHILPGIIDAHVHFRDPGLTEKEDFESGSAAAAFGGITLAADMPNVIPVTSTVERFNEKTRIAGEKSYIDFALFALAPDNLTEMEGLRKAGALGFKVFFGTSTGDIAAPSPSSLFEMMSQCAKTGMRIGFHAEISELNSHFTEICKNAEGVKNGRLLEQARPVLSEILAIQIIIRYAQSTGAKIHIHHVTSADGALFIAEAKKTGVKISAETCPHYLLLDADRVCARVYPPIRDKAHHDGLWNALKNGTIDMIASDHAPHTANEKNLPFWEAPAGLCGVETLVPLFLNEVNKGKLSLNDFVRLASEAPAKIWGIYPQKGNLLPGADADLTVVDMKRKTKISADRLHSKSKTSPYDGMETEGTVASTIVRGKFVVKDGELTGNRGFGALVSPANERT
ncbi:MAG: dihydroorotase family protein [Treponema sp.]|nr:dihydroorotase family protein [Treponema sp.]